MGTKKIDIIQSAQITALEADVLELRTKLNLVVQDAQAISTKLNQLINDLNDMNEVVMDGYTTPSSPESYGILEALDVYKDQMTDHLETFTGLWFQNANDNNNLAACSLTTPRSSWWHYNYEPSWDSGGTGTYGQHVTIGAGIHNSPSPYHIDMVYGTTPSTHPPATLTDCSSGGGNYRVANSGSDSGTAGYGAKVVDGTGQSGNTSHSADAEDTENIKASYRSGEKRLLIKKSSVPRAKKLIRQTLNRLRK